MGVDVLAHPEPEVALEIDVRPRPRDSRHFLAVRGKDDVGWTGINAKNVLHRLFSGMRKNGVVRLPVDDGLSRAATNHAHAVASCDERQIRRAFLRLKILAADE